MKKTLSMVLICILCLGFASAIAEEDANTIAFICSAGGSGRSFEGGLNNFIKANDGKINMSIDMISMAALPEQLMTQFLSGSVFYDCMAINSVWQASMANYLYPLNSFIQRDKIDVYALYGNSMDANTYEGNIIGLPVRTGTDVLYYNKEMLEATGLSVPTDINALLNAARAMTRGPEENREVYGFAFMAQDPFYCTSATADLLFAYGIYFLNEDMTAPNEDLLSENATQIFEVIQIMYEEKLMPNPMVWTYDDSIVALQEGRLAMVFDDFMRAPTVEKEGGGATGKIGYHSFQPTPTGSNPPRARGGWWILSMDKNTVHPDECWEFIKYMCGLETQTYMAYESSNGPSILSLLDDPVFNEINKGAAAGRANFETLGMRDPVSIGCRDELANAIQEIMHSLFLGRIKPNEAGPAMYEAFGDILSDYEE